MTELKALQARWVILAGAFLPWAGVFAAGPNTTSDELRRAQLMREPGLRIVDVRSEQEYAAGHIQGAAHIPAALVQGANLPRDGRVVLYCSNFSCPLSANAAAALLNAGYQNVSHLAGGFAQWEAQGYPIERGVPLRPGRPIAQLKVSEAKKKLKTGKLLTLDVRPASEFAAGHVPGARNVPLEEIDAAVGWLEKDKTLLVYDRLSERSRKAARKLKEAGFNVVELAGGMGGWLKRKGSLEVK
jgi:rhodanese-related sulfurtransferase